MKFERIGFSLFSAFLFLALSQSCSRPPSAPSLPTPTPVPPGCPIVGTVNLTGNLNSNQPASSTGGVLDLSPSGSPILPLGYVSLMGPTFYNSAKMQFIPYGSGGSALQLTGDPTQPLDTTNLQPHLTTPILNGGLMGSWTYTWVTPACLAVKTVTDAGGNSRQITFQFFQVHDLGTASPVINSAPLTQALWAWYAFDTTAGQPVGNASFLGGTGVVEGVTGLQCSIDHGNTGTIFIGDLLCFNPDGSLAMEGAFTGPPGPAGPINYEVQPSLYLPSFNGSAISRFVVNFGTAGMPGFGQRDGLTGDAAPCNVN